MILASGCGGGRVSYVPVSQVSHGNRYVDVDNSRRRGREEKPRMSGASNAIHCKRFIAPDSRQDYNFNIVSQESDNGEFNTWTGYSLLLLNSTILVIRLPLYIISLGILKPPGWVFSRWLFLTGILASRDSNGIRPAAFRGRTQKLPKCNRLTCVTASVSVAF